MDQQRQYPQLASLGIASDDESGSGVSSATPCCSKDFSNVSEVASAALVALEDFLRSLPVPRAVTTMSESLPLERWHPLFALLALYLSV